MPIERIKSLDIDNRELFTAIYGLNGSSEVYITPDLRVHNMREALYLYLKRQGYSVVFYDDKAFSFEEAPLIEFFNLSPGSHDSIHVESAGNQRRYVVYQSESIFKDIYSYARRTPWRKMAVVFVSPLTLTFDDEQRKSILNSWNDLNGDFRRNRISMRIIALYEFASPRLFSQAFESATDELLLLPPFKELVLDDIGRNDNETGTIIEGRHDRCVFYLGAPGLDEIGHMLNRRRLLSPEGLPHLFGKIGWDNVVLRLWQDAAAMKGGISLISEFLEAPDLDRRIAEIDTVRAIDRLDSLEGIDNIRKQFDLYRRTLRAHRSGCLKGRFRPHMAMTGSRGTGKSTVARLFGDILREEGLLSKGHFIKVTPGELTGQYAGETRPKTRAVCERARGGVLFIADAYELMSGRNPHGDADYGSEAIEVLIQFMEDNDDTLVIFSGYTDEINLLIHDGNKGFRRRFNDLGFFEFHDYSPDVLFNIASRMIDIPSTERFMKGLRAIIRYKWAYRNRKFGNVGDMENLVGLIKATYSNLGVNEPLDICHLPESLRILADDSVLNPDDMLADINAVIGQEGVKALVIEIYTKVVADRIKLQTIDSFIPSMPKLNFLFTGNPGTGKASAGRIVGNLLRRLGVLPTATGDVLTTISGSTLLRASTQDIRKLFDDNIGKVVFIDNACELTGNPRVVTDIMAMVDEPEFKNKLSIILAGHPGKIRALRNINEDFDRRFREVAFSDYTDDELYEILLRMIDSTPNTVIDAEACRQAGTAFFASLRRNSKFGNAGEAENLLQILMARRDERFVKASVSLKRDVDFAQRILPCDFPATRPAASPSSLLRPTPHVPCRPAAAISGKGDEFAVAKGAHIYSAVGLLETEDGTGTAFIISRTHRYILTASHIVEGRTRFDFTLNRNGKLHHTAASLLWLDSELDMAMLQAESLPDDARFLRIDTTTPREPSTQVRIAAFPLGRQISNKVLLTSGSISNYEENLSVENGDGIGRCFNAIRTEAQATYGSSGSPVLLADSFRVVGVLHGGISENGFYMNIASDIAQIASDPIFRILENV